MFEFIDGVYWYSNKIAPKMYEMSSRYRIIPFVAEQGTKGIRELRGATYFPAIDLDNAVDAIQMKLDTMYDGFILDERGLIEDQWWISRKFVWLKNSKMSE